MSHKGVPHPAVWRERIHTFMTHLIVGPYNMCGHAIPEGELVTVPDSARQNECATENVWSPGQLL